MARSQLFIGRLPVHIRERDIEQVFEKYGKLLRCDIKFGGGMAYAFVDYDDRRDAEDAIKYENGRDLKGNNIVVEWARGPSSRSNDQRGECFRCRRTGHWARDCPEFDTRDRYSGGQSRHRSFRRPRRSYSRSRSRERTRRSHDRRDRTKSRSRSRSRTPLKTKDTKRNTYSRSVSKSRSRSRSYPKEKLERSVTPRKEKNNNTDENGNKSISRSRSKERSNGSEYDAPAHRSSRSRSH